MSKQNRHNQGPDTSAVGEQLAEELESLLTRSVFEEANAAVWQRFESALHGLDEASLSIFEQYLDGVSIKQLSRDRKLSEDEVRLLISSMKKELLQKLGQVSQIKQ